MKTTATATLRDSPHLSSPIQVSTILQIYHDRIHQINAYASHRYLSSHDRTILEQHCHALWIANQVLICLQAQTSADSTTTTIAGDDTVSKDNVGDVWNSHQLQSLESTQRQCEILHHQLLQIEEQENMNSSSPSLTTARNIQPLPEITILAIENARVPVSATSMTWSITPVDAQSNVNPVSTTTAVPFEMSIMDLDPESMAYEEQELIRMANTPIPGETGPSESSNKQDDNDQEEETDVSDSMQYLERRKAEILSAWPLSEYQYWVQQQQILPQPSGASVQ
jgi:hypothetical protein